MNDLKIIELFNYISCSQRQNDIKVERNSCSCGGGQTFTVFRDVTPCSLACLTPFKKKTNAFMRSSLFWDVTQC
jgi:hypothetical protein